MGNSLDERRLQWHPGFQAALQIELAADIDFLQFFKEYNLTEKPLQPDTLVIKRESGRTVSKSIGRIFRRYNIIEYKSPEDYVSINDFYKVVGYTCIYQSGTDTVNQIRPDELTITFACYRYLRELIKHLQTDYDAAVEEKGPGIYYLKYLMFPVQIILIGKLPASEYIWLSRMRPGLRLAEDIELLAGAYRGKEKLPLYEAVMNLIVRANKTQYEEGKRMCDALRELFADELDAREICGIERGMERGIEQGIEQGIADSVLELLTELGQVPDRVKDAVYSQTDSGLLKSWLKLAAKAESFEQFMKAI